MLNIGGDLFFLKVIPMGRGAAVATVLSQFIAPHTVLCTHLEIWTVLWISRKDFQDVRCQSV